MISDPIALNKLALKTNTVAMKALTKSKVQFKVFKFSSYPHVCARERAWSSIIDSIYLSIQLKPNTHLAARREIRDALD
jgi:hypothetical protein